MSKYPLLQFPTQPSSKKLYQFKLMCIRLIDKGESKHEKEAIQKSQKYKYRNLKYLLKYSYKTKIYRPNGPMFPLRPLKGIKMCYNLYLENGRAYYQHKKNNDLNKLYRLSCNYLKALNEIPLQYFLSKPFQKVRGQFYRIRTLSLPFHKIAAAKSILQVQYLIITQVNKRSMKQLNKIPKCDNLNVTFRGYEALERNSKTFLPSLLASKVSNTFNFDVEHFNYDQLIRGKWSFIEDIYSLKTSFYPILDQKIQQLANLMELKINIVPQHFIKRSRFEPLYLSHLQRLKKLYVNANNSTGVYIPIFEFKLPKNLESLGYELKYSPNLRDFTTQKAQSFGANISEMKNLKEFEIKFSKVINDLTLMIIIENGISSLTPDLKRLKLQLQFQFPSIDSYQDNDFWITFANTKFQFLNELSFNCNFPTHYFDANYKKTRMLKVENLTLKANQPGLKIIQYVFQSYITSLTILNSKVTGDEYETILSFIEGCTNLKNFEGEFDSSDLQPSVTFDSIFQVLRNNANLKSFKFVYRSKKVFLTNQIIQYLKSQWAYYRSRVNIYISLDNPVVYGGKFVYVS